MDFYDWDHEIMDLGSIGDDGSFMGLGGFSGDDDGLLMKSSQSLVLDDNKNELVKAESKVAGKRAGLMCDEKALAALKSHSEAERRRRERINKHLDTLRGLVPCTDKMDKATLLAEVIRQVKQLQINAKQASLGLVMPEDIEEVKIEKIDHAAVNGSLTFHASVCCKHRPELLTDIRRALGDLKVNIERAEFSTLGDHMKIVFYFTADEKLLSSVREALTSVIEKGSISLDYSPRTMLPNKRRRYCL
ncbi:transcription factor bHLH30-like [Bidens hawaiensis]|uniref:transcription factor bHLH30-like n=1 Tax=Bidens hawaiensis TaxID=980011 RepID=UPI00404A4AEA